MFAMFLYHRVLRVALLFCGATLLCSFVALVLCVDMVWWYAGTVVRWYGGMVAWWYGGMVVWWCGGRWQVAYEYPTHSIAKQGWQMPIRDFLYSMNLDHRSITIPSAPTFAMSSSASHHRWY